MSRLPQSMTQRKEVVLNSVAEFLGIWALRGEASLSLNTKDGVTTIAFTHSLSGHPEDPLHPPPAPVGTSRQRRRRRRRGPARRERDRQRAARHQAAQAGAPPASPPPAASPAVPSTPEVLRETGGSNLDTLAISPTNEKREEEEEDLPTSNLKPEHPPLVEGGGRGLETLRIANEMGRTGKCIFCDFSCEPNPGVASWYNEPLLDHREEAHPETVQWFY